jgi:N-acyl-D-amino-acid deacylase
MRFTVLGLLCSAAIMSAADYDLVLRGGRVVDGTGNPAFFADVAVKGGQIVAIGRIDGSAEREVEAAGKIVCPGFIDVHTHAEEVDDLPLAENFVRMGVTTIVLGNCGSSAVDVGAFFKRLEATNTSLNVATLIGHGSVRSRVMGGSFMRPPTDDELGRMKELVEQAMKNGAVGLSTGLIYLPGTFAKTDEIIELAKVAARYDGIYASHMRSEGEGIFDALDELFRIAREARIRAEVSHIKLSGKQNWGQPDKVLAAIESARAEGLDITQDQYAYTASSTGISQLIPEEVREGGKFKERMADAGQKAKVVAEMKDKLRRGQRSDYAYAMIADYKHDRSLNGLNIVEATRKTRASDSVEDQIELILEIQKNGGASGVFHGINEDDLRSFLQNPNTLIASDSGIRRWREGVPHPRGYGNNARVLGRYVRELKVLRLEDAIRRMTSLPASTFRLRQRGLLREGHWADIVVFDAEKVQDNATFKEPHQYATGFDHVFVNGVEVIAMDKHTRARPGQVLRHATAR